MKIDTANFQEISDVREPTLAIVEEQAALTIRALRDSGLLARGGVCALSWAVSGRPVLAAQLTVGREGCILTSPQLPSGSQSIPLVWKKCRFGGERPFWVCPDCERTVLALYLGSKGFSCRHCLNLTYRSRNEPKWGADLWQAQKLRRKLGGDPYQYGHVPDRPKGMWVSTYNHIKSELVERELGGIPRLQELANKALGKDWKR